MPIRSIRDLDLRDKKLLLRVDFNVPVDASGSILDDTRIRAALPTIQYAIQQGAKVILMSHFGRPKGVDPKYSLKPCAERLSLLLNKPVSMSPDYTVKPMQPGDITLLENLRFNPAEEKPALDPNFAKSLAALGDVYVDDAFGAAHRAHSSITEIPKYFPDAKGAGFLLEKEIQFLGSHLQAPARPFYAIIGGSKVSTKIGVLKSLLTKVDALFIGGAMAFTFFKAEGLTIGNSLFEEACLSEAYEFLRACKEKGVQLFLPVDTMCEHNNVFEGDIPDGFQGLDIGPKTIALWSTELKKAKTVLWNGPVGKFEVEEFSTGTKAIAKVLGSMKDTTTIAGGGETVQAIHESGLEEKFSHISTGGGASLEYIEQGTLPGIEALLME